MNARRVASTLQDLALIILAITTLIPLGLMLLNSLKTNAEIQADPLALPGRIQLQNFGAAWDQARLGPAILMSSRVACLSVLFTCATAVPAAYALARRKIRSWRFVGGYFLLATTVPITLLVFPLYGVLVRAGLLGNSLVLSLVYCALYTPFSMFLLRSYFLAIPHEIEEAARIDGASEFQIFWRVMLPLVRPGILTVAIIVTLFSWNEFLLALTLFQGSETKTAVVQFLGFQGRYDTQLNLMMAAAVLLAAPVILAFLALQRFFVEGITGGSVKG